MVLWAPTLDGLGFPLERARHGEGTLIGMCLQGHLVFVSSNSSSGFNKIPLKQSEWVSCRDPAALKEPGIQLTWLLGD